MQYTGKYLKKTVLMLAMMAGLSVGQSQAAVELETRSLDQIYKSALSEGGTVTVYAGGDVQSQQAGFKRAFETRFPGIKLNVIVDYSKYHDARIDNQLASDALVPDVVQLQTVQNYPRWKKEGVLLNYKPRGWDKIYPEFRDADGAWIGAYVIAFSNLVNTQLLDEKSWPREANDYLRPSLRGNLILAYPNDDDAVLFWYKLVVDKYGWDFVKKLQEQDPVYVRGTNVPGVEIATGKYSATFTSSGALVPAADSVTRFVLPKSDPFVSWAQRAAILKQAKHPESAKLYLSWLLDPQTQTQVSRMWSVRTDVAPPAGYKPIWEYRNTRPQAFADFMYDRGAVERFRAQLSLYIGEVKGEPTPGWLGPRPTVPLVN
ncbi:MULTISPECIES: ABC transporter substrate-binding protein [Pectobacterium]|uniref:Extracellular solute-binding protein n=1 Tax=Pectobacterium punjabense TaxID=2108399 RepID=A0ABX6L308_9GAMM|nr:MULTISPECIES: extracellular solute-binding protein [Pectobacterium]GKW12771.1 ABC transporter substrate-binding protein [Pectobacterium carotovorum subsp. carotovorum]MBS4431960.1 extracellular solute-binding protein [Pectobacterium punjabense]MBT9183213.1 extracellular solute-binding protein [Pectobacterium punjabense]MCE9730078.1 peptide ABC transporter substrate-binding protein [Pectobacterium sp. IFB5596]PTA63908.1 peptide ABC transporter substrate-binding protein [Pectobacterium punjab